MAADVRTAAVVLLLALVTTALAGIATMRLETKVDFVDAVPPHAGLDPYRRILTELDGARSIVVYMPGQGLRDDAGFDALVHQQARLSAALAAAFPDAFTHMLSAYESMRAAHYMGLKMATAGNPPADSYALPPPGTWDLFRDDARAAADNLLAKDGKSALLLAFPAADDRDLALRVEAFLASWDDPGPTTGWQVSGLLHAAAYTDRINREDTSTYVPLAAVAVLLVLWWATRGFLNALAAVVGLSFALIWTYGTMVVLGMRLSFLSVFLAPVVIGVGIDHAVHVLSRIEESGSVRAALRRFGPSIALAAGTSVAAVASLIFVKAPLFSDIGILATIGLAYAGIAALTVVPALRSLWRIKPRADRVGPLLSRASLAVWRPAGIVLLLVVLGVASAGSFAARPASGEADNELPQDDPVVLLQSRIEQEYGAFHRAYLVFEGDLAEPRVLRAIHDARQAAVSLPLYRDATAVTDLLIADAKTDEGVLDVAMGAALSRPDREFLPTTAAEAKERLAALYADPLWSRLVPFSINDAADLAVVAIEIEAWQAEDLGRLSTALFAIAKQAADDSGITVTGAGSPENRAAVLAAGPPNLTIAILGSAVGVGVVLSLGWARRGKDGFAMAAAGVGLVLASAAVLLAAVPALDATYRMLAGLGGVANRAPLTDMFLLAFAITVAVGADGLVHVATRYWAERPHGRAVALRRAWDHTGRAVVGTVLSSTVAFATMAGVYFLQSKNLAILSAVGIVASFVLTLLSSPWLLGGFSASRRRGGARPSPSPRSRRP